MVIERLVAWTNSCKDDKEINQRDYIIIQSLSNKIKSLKDLKLSMNQML